MRLTLRTLLAYLDDTLPPAEALAIGKKVAESDHARDLVEKIKRLPRKRGLAVPANGKDDSPSNPNTVAEYLSDALASDAVASFEAACLDQDVNLAEVAACHQILTLLLSEPARVPPTARKRMYELVKGPESLPNRKPGRTIPVGGVPPAPPTPEAAGADPGFLFGLSPAAVGVKWALAAGLAAVAAVALWLAWPVEAIPVPPAEITEVTPPPANDPKPTTVPPVETLPNPAAAEGPKSPDPTPSPLPTPSVTKVDPPKTDELAIDPQKKILGTLVTKEAVVVAETAPGIWDRLPAGGPVTSGARIVATPGYKATVRLDSGVVVDLWANVPDQIPNGPHESAVTFHAPAASVAADLTLHAGRIYVQSSAAGATVRVRTATGIRDVRLDDASAEAAVDVAPVLTRGMSVKATVSTPPVVSLAATRGLVSISRPPTRVASQSLRAGDGHVETTGPASTPAEIGKRLARQSVYPDAVAAAAAQRGLATLAAGVTPGARVSVALAEVVAGTSVSAARVAVSAQAAIGELGDVVGALLDPNRTPVRDAAATALRALLAEDPDRAERIAGALIAKGGFTKDQADAVLALLRGPTDAEERDPVVLTRLVDGLTADTLPVRELSHRTLLMDVDPEALRNSSLVRYDATGPVEAREACQKLWRQRVADLTK